MTTKSFRVISFIFFWLQQRYEDCVTVSVSHRLFSICFSKSAVLDNVEVFLFTNRQMRVDSIAVSLFTNSETAAATPLRVMRNFQRTLNQWRHNLTDCFLIDGPSHICQLTSEYIFVEFCSISRSWGGHFLNLFLNFAFLRIILDIDTNRWR